MSNKKDYLNLVEQESWLSTLTLADYVDVLIKSWSKNLEREELKKFRTAVTLIRNGLKMIANRVHPREKDKLIKKSRDFQVILVSNNQARITRDKVEKENETVTIDRVELEKVIQDLRFNLCSNCNKQYYECEICSFLYKIDMPRFEIRSNCPFSLINHSNKKKSSKRAKKKANRYDDPGEDYEYNFEPKGVK